MMYIRPAINGYLITIEKTDYTADDFIFTTWAEVVAFVSQMSMPFKQPGQADV